MKRDSEIIGFARETLKVEAEAVRRQARQLDGNFVDSARAILACSRRGSRLIITGVGKSGLIGRKIAATFSSLGVAAVFVHPTEMLHGDLGMLVKGDVVLALSYSGETDELKRIFPAIKGFGLKSISFTGAPKSTIARFSDRNINVSVAKEASCYNFVPTSSTTAMLAMGDALALCVALMRGLKQEDFARLHPGGSLGAKLTVKVGHLMRSGRNMPVVGENVPVKKALNVMSEKKLGAVMIVDSRGILSGYFTDGDLRRKIPSDPLLLKKKIGEVMTRKPKVTGPGEMAADVARMFEEFNFDNMPVVDIKGKPVGIIDERDLITAGLA